MITKVCRVAALVCLAAMIGASANAQILTKKVERREDPIFFGSAPFNTVPGSLALETSGTLKTPFLTRQVTWARTGLSTQDAEVSGTWGAIKFPKGTRFYAMPFQDGFSSQRDAMAAQGIKVPDVAWCTPDIKPKKGKPYCFFIGIFGRFGYGSSGVGSPYYPEYMGVSSYNAVFAEPNIVEQPVDFGTPLTLDVQVKKISKKSIKVEITLFDGTKRSDVFSDKLQRAEDGSARFSLWGGELEIVPSGKKAFEVRVVRPLSEDVAPDDEKLIPPYVLRS